MLYRIQQSGRHVLTFSIKSGGIFGVAQYLANHSGCRVHVVQSGMSVMSYDGRGFVGRVEQGHYDIVKGITVDGEVVWRRTQTTLFVEHYAFANKFVA